MPAMPCCPRRTAAHARPARGGAAPGASNRRACNRRSPSCDSCMSHPPSDFARRPRVDRARPRWRQGRVRATRDRALGTRLRRTAAVRAGCAGSRRGRTTGLRPRLARTSTFQERSRFSTWLYRIAFNEAQRQLARRPSSAVQQPADDVDAIAALPAASGSGPRSAHSGREFEQVLARRVGATPRRPARRCHPPRPRGALNRGGRVGDRHTSGRLQEPSAPRTYAATRPARAVPQARAGALAGDSDQPVDGISIVTPQASPERSK